MFAVLAAIVALLVLVAMLGSREKQSDAIVPVPASATSIAQPTTASLPPIGKLSPAEIRSALTDVCSGATPESDNELSREDIQAQYDAFVELQLSLSERLSASAAAEHLHLAALLSDDPALRIELLDRAIAGHPSDPFLIWGAVQICSEVDAAIPCPLPDWEKRLIAVDGQNSESWVRIAANRYAAGEYDQALDAMRYASTAAESRAYWTETIEMIERGFAAGSDFAFPERAFMAVGVAASRLPRYGDYVTMCKEQSAKNVDWAHTCIAYGELVEHQGKTEMGVAIARSIQKLALEALGEWEKAAEVEQRLQARRQQRTDRFNNDNDVTERLVFSNPTLFYSYLAAVRSKGELEARLYLTEEVERLIEQQPELACKPE
jgi:hypothetical protein